MNNVIYLNIKWCIDRELFIKFFIADITLKMWPTEEYACYVLCLPQYRLHDIILSAFALVKH